MSHTGWFPSTRFVYGEREYMYVCLTADRSSGRLKVTQRDLATALKKSRRCIVNCLEEPGEHQMCGSDESPNQHVAGHIEVCDRFWPYVKCRRDQDDGEMFASYVEAIRQLLAARKCLNQVFNSVDERLAAQLFREQSRQRRSSTQSCSPARADTSHCSTERWKGPFRG
jgi:hypothetical protein